METKHIYYTAYQEVVHKVTVSLPCNAMAILRFLDDLFPSSEYLLVTEGQWEGLDKFRVSSKWVIPEQESFRYLVQPTEFSSASANVVIHKHLDGITNFSLTDLHYLSTNFDVSLLWAAGQFCNTSIRLQADINDKKALIILQKYRLVYTEEPVCWLSILSQIHKVHVNLPTIWELLQGNYGRRSY